MIMSCTSTLPQSSMQRSHPAGKPLLLLNLTLHVLWVGWQYRPCIPCADFGVLGCQDFCFIKEPLKVDSTPVTTQLPYTVLNRIFF